MAACLFLLTGLCLFLGGLCLMTAGLEQLGGSFFASALRRFTGNRLSAFACGLLFTGLTQSSSLTTVMVVGMVEARLLALGPAIAVIIGANVGTTVTGQLLSFNIQMLALPLALAGVVLVLLADGEKSIQAGRTLLGLSMLLFGLRVMGGVLAPLGETAWFAALLQSAEKNPLYGVLAGAVATALVQSSSAVVGMALELAHNGMLGLVAGVSLMVGADVGTCVTSLLAGLGAGPAAKQAAVAHLLFNVFSTLLVLPVFDSFVRLASITAFSVPRQLANAHTLYNVIGAALLLVCLTPFQRLIESVAGVEKSQKKRIFRLIGEWITRWF